MPDTRGRSRTAAPGPPPAGTPGGLAAAVQEHVAWLEAAHYAATTVRSRRRHLQRFLAWAEVRGITTVADVTLPVLERYRHTLYHTRKADGEALSWGTQTQKLLAVTQFLKWAARMHLVATNAGAELTLPRRPQRLPRAVLNVSEVEAVLAQPDLADPIGVRDRAILETLYSTGMRRHELRQLTLPDVDHERGVVYIHEGKGRKDRVVPIGERALDWIARYVDDVRPLHAVEPDAGTLFLTQRGRPLRSNRLTELVHGYVEAAGTGKTGSCHLFRHTMATLMLEGGADLRAIQEILGHAQLTTTELYTRVAIGRLKAIHTRTHPAHQTRPPRAQRAGTDGDDPDALLASLAAEESDAES